MNEASLPPGAWNMLRVCKRLPLLPIRQVSGARFSLRRNPHTDAGSQTIPGPGGGRNGGHQGTHTFVHLNGR